MMEPGQDSSPDCLEKNCAMGRTNGLKKLSWPGVTSRVMAASLGGYGLTYAATASFTLLLPLPKSEAVG